MLYTLNVHSVVSPKGEGGFLNTLLPEMTISCSIVDLFTLASLLGGEMLIGVPDPFPGWLTEEIDETMVAARQNLVERGYLTLHPNGQVVMDVVVAAQVGTLVAPQTVFLLTVAVPDQLSYQVAFYHRSPLTVAMEKNGDEWRLQPLSELESIPEQIQKNWKIKAQKPVQVEPISLPKKYLELARDAISSGKESVQMRLEESGIDTTSARALALTLMTPRRNGALVAMRPHQNTWEVGGLGVLESENGLWLLRSFTRQQDEWVELIPCSAKKLSAEIEVLLKRFLPSKEA